MSRSQQQQPELGLREANRRVHELTDRVTEQRLRLAIARTQVRGRIERAARRPSALVAMFAAGIAVGYLPNQRRLLGVAAFGLKARSTFVRMARLATKTKTKSAPEGALPRTDVY